MILNRNTFNGAALNARPAKFHIWSVRWWLARPFVSYVLTRMARPDLPWRAARPVMSATPKQTTTTRS